MNTASHTNGVLCLGGGGSRMLFSAWAGSIQSPTDWNDPRQKDGGYCIAFSEAVFIKCGGLCKGSLLSANSIQMGIHQASNFTFKGILKQVYLHCFSQFVWKHPDFRVFLPLGCFLYHLLNMKTSFRRLVWVICEQEICYFNAPSKFRRETQREGDGCFWDTLKKLPTSFYCGKSEWELWSTSLQATHLSSL